MIFTNVPIGVVIFIFIIAAITDWLDGQLARKFKWVSEFGRKTDMIADRFLWMGTAAAFVIVFGMDGSLRWFHGVMLLLTMTREVISAPFAIIAFMSGREIPHARYAAKVTTFIQGFALPLIILSVFYPMFIYAAIPLAIACSITGFWSAMHYINDIRVQEQKNAKARRKKN